MNNDQNDSEKTWCQKVYEYLKRENSQEGVLISQVAEVIGSGSMKIKGKVKKILQQDDRFTVLEGKQAGIERVSLKTSHMQMLPSTVLPPALYSSSSSSITHPHPTREHWIDQAGLDETVTKKWKEEAGIRPSTAQKWIDAIFEFLNENKSHTPIYSLINLGRIVPCDDADQSLNLKELLQKDARFVVTGDILTSVRLKTNDVQKNEEGAESSSGISGNTDVVGRGESDTVNITSTNIYSKVPIVNHIVEKVLSFIRSGNPVSFLSFRWLAKTPGDKEPSKLSKDVTREIRLILQSTPDVLSETDDGALWFFLSSHRSLANARAAMIATKRENKEAKKADRAAKRADKRAAKNADIIAKLQLTAPPPSDSRVAAGSANSTRPSDITLVSTMKPNGATYESLLDGKCTPDTNINRDGDPVNNNIVNDDDDDDNDNDDDDNDNIEEKDDNDGIKEDNNNIKKGKISYKINNMESRQLRVDALTAAIGESENDTDINDIIDGLLSPKEPHGNNGHLPVDVINIHRQSVNKKQDAANTAEEHFHAYTTFAASVKEEPPSLKISAASTLPSSASTLPPILGTLTDTFLGLTPFTGPSHVTGHLLDAGCTISTRASRADAFIESTLFGLLDEHSSDSDVDLIGIGSNIDTNEEERGTINLPKPTAVYLNTHEPFCFVTVGVQGGGKSHTLGCVLEACLVPVPEEGIAELSAPMSALVLHFDPSPTSVCEVTGLIRPSDKLSGCNLSRNLPREKMIVLVSPSFYKQRKAFYGDYCEVRPLLFSWSSLTADHLRCIMQLTDADN